MIIQNYISKLKVVQKLTNFGLLAVTLHFALCTLHMPLAFAQVSSIGIANYVEINNSKIEDGDIVVTTPKGFVLSTQEYDPEVFGVVSMTPGVALKTTTDKKTYPVVSSGRVIVKVSSVNGAIKKGDFITASTIPGTGMRASRSGFVIGQALEDAVFDKSKAGTVAISLNMHALQTSGLTNSLLNILNLSRIATYEAPTKVVQYVVAALIMLTSFGIGFVIFAKAVNTGLEALGRNPLAARTIQISIAFNLILIGVIIVAGTALAYLVIRL